MFEVWTDKYYTKTVQICSMS